MHKLLKFLESLEHYELVKLRQYIEKGTVQDMVQKKIDEHEKKHMAICAACSNTLSAYSINNFTMIFGPDDFRKKASFCGLDCLEYFLLKLKEIKSDKIGKVRQSF